MASPLSAVLLFQASSAKCQVLSAAALLLLPPLLPPVPSGTPPPPPPLTHLAHICGGPADRYDIGTGVPAAQKKLLLGGEMSMWSDTYCYIEQCGSHVGKPPVGHELFDPKNDKEFGESIGGMIWPRGYVGAAAYWNYDASVNVASAEFTKKIWDLNDQLVRGLTALFLYLEYWWRLGSDLSCLSRAHAQIKRGSLTCPSKCACNQLTACGKPYLKSQGNQTAEAN